MPSPVTPSDAAAIVPAPSSDICQKIKLIFLQFPALFRDLVDWMLDDNGNPSQEFLTAVSPLAPGDFKFSAVESPGMGWLYCNGQAVSRTTYAALFAAIGTTFGVGDGSTTFNVPDCRNRFLLGVSASKALGVTGGLEDVTLLEAQMPNHFHSFTGSPIGTNMVTPNRTIIDDDVISSSTLTRNTTSAGSGQSHTNMPPYVTVFIHIKY